MFKSENGRDILIGIILGVAFFGFLVIYPRLPKKDVLWEEIVVCLKENMKDEDVMIFTISGYSDYDNRESFLYLSDNYSIIERNVVTGIEQEISIFGLEENIYENGENNINRVRYVPNGNKISFLKNEKLYVYDYRERNIVNEMECMNVIDYEWLSEKKFCVLSRDGLARQLYVCEGNDKEKILVEKSIRSIESSNTEDKIYAIREYVKADYDSLLEYGYDIVEVNLQNGSIRNLVEDVNLENFFLECIDGKYLFYEERKYGRNRLYCLNLMSGEKSCIYKSKYNLVRGVTIR